MAEGYEFFTLRRQYDPDGPTGEADGGRILWYLKTKTIRGMDANDVAYVEVEAHRTNEEIYPHFGLRLKWDGCRDWYAPSTHFCSFHPEDISEQDLLALVETVGRYFFASRFPNEYSEIPGYRLAPHDKPVGMWSISDVLPQGEYSKEFDPYKTYLIELMKTVCPMAAATLMEGKSSLLFLESVGVVFNQPEGHVSLFKQEKSHNVMSSYVRLYTERFQQNKEFYKRMTDNILGAVMYKLAELQADDFLEAYNL